MDILKEKWDQILQTVKVEHELSDISFKTWLQPLQLHEITDTTVTILVPNEQMAIDYISKKVYVSAQGCHRRVHRKRIQHRIYPSGAGCRAA